MSQIDYSQDSKKVFFDLINQENTTTLLASDFDVSDPVPYVGNKPNVNTSVLLTPKAGTGWYGSVNIYCNRMELASIFSTQGFSYNPQIETTLYALLPKLNEAFGIHLKEEDIFDAAIPPFNAQQPTAPRIVLIAAKSTSYFFQGSYELVLGVNNTPIIEDDGKVRLYYLYIEGYDLPNIKESMTSLQIDGSINADFNFLFNVSDVQQYEFHRIERLRQGTFAIVGNFSLTYQTKIYDAALDQMVDTVLTKTDIKTLIVDFTGRLVTDYTYAYFDDITESLSSDFTNFVSYATTTALIKYSHEDGKLVNTYVPGIGYAPKLVRVMEDGRIYTVSPIVTMADQYNNFVETKQLRIDRLMSTGELDPTFNPVFVKSSDSTYLVPEVYDLLPLSTGGLLVYFKPTGGLSNSSPVPMVNGRQIVSLNTGSQARYTWNPIVRLNADGSTDNTFNSSLQQFDEGVIMSSPQNVLSINGNYLSATEDEITTFTYKKNPLTGYTHIQPNHFSWSGQYQLFAGSYYVDQYAWSSLKDIVRQTNGQVLSYGLMQSFQVNGTLSAPYSALARYRANSSVDKVLWRSSGPMGGINPMLSKVFLEESEINP